MDVNSLTGSIIGAAIEVHKAPGPGLLEVVYEECLCYELAQRNIGFQRQYRLPIRYKEVYMECGYRIDILVEDRVVLELKAVERLTPLHEAQLLSYLKSGRWNIGFLINFNVPVLMQGVKRKVLNLHQH